VNISQSINKLISWTYRGHGELNRLFMTLYQQHAQNCALDIYIIKSHLTTPTSFGRQGTFIREMKQSNTT